MTDQKHQPPWAARLKAERDARGWNKREMARHLLRAAGHDHGSIDSLARQIRGWESGEHFPRDWATAYALVFDLDENTLFNVSGSSRDEVHALPLLVSSPLPGARPASSASPLTIEAVEGLLRRLYRLEAEFGGNELCVVIADQVEAASSLFKATSLNLKAERRLLGAVAGLAQVAGWLFLDANRHGDASRYLSATVYAAHELDDLGLAGHALGYMSLHAFYRDQPKKALALSQTACDLVRGEGTPRMRATLHNRAARAHARLGDAVECERQFDLARAEFAADEQSDDDPEWIRYVSEIEIVAQRGACYLDLERPDDAITAITEAIALVQATAPGDTRDLAHYKTRLAAAYLLLNEPEQAVSVASEAHSLAARIGSARVSERFTELVARMEPFDVPEVHAFLEQVNPRRSEVLH
jgi:tetratricopeptide (TPR) repeat protein